MDLNDFALWGLPHNFADLPEDEQVEAVRKAMADRRRRDPDGKLMKQAQLGYLQMRNRKAR